MQHVKEAGVPWGQLSLSAVAPAVQAAADTRVGAEVGAARVAVEGWSCCQGWSGVQMRAHSRGGGGVCSKPL
jgi:hypothetical protein